jgi:hypothetical protein
MVGLMDVIDEDEELIYLDDDTPATASQKKNLALQSTETIVELAVGKGENSGLRAHDPINLDSLEAEKPEAGQSISPPPILKDDRGSMMDISKENVASPAKDTLALQLEKAGSLFDLSLSFSFL